MHELSIKLAIESLLMAMSPIVSLAGRDHHGGGMYKYNWR
jgi:hypothetical protein